MGCLLLCGYCFGWSNWKTLKTKNFVVFYKPEKEYQARELLSIIEYHRPRVERLTGNSRKKLPLVIEDVGALSNGFADPVFKRVVVYPYSPSDSELRFIENWPELVGVHEYTHMLHLTNAGGFPQVLSIFFGNIFSPNIYSPGWIIEGIAVYSESGFSKYSGRLNDGMFDAYIGARVKDNKFPSIVEATNSPLSFPYYTGIYLYGGEFFRYLAEKYKEKRFPYFFNTYGSNLLSYYSPFVPWIGLDMCCKGTYEKYFPGLWKEWKQYEREKHKDFSIDGKRLTYNGWYVDNSIIEGDKLYYRKNYIVKTGAFRYFSFNDIVERDLYTSKERVLVSIPSLYTAPFKVKNHRIYYSVAELKSGYHNINFLGFGVYSELHQKDIESGEDEILFDCSLRAFDVKDTETIVFSEDRGDGFGSDIYKFNGRHYEKEKLFSCDYLVNEITYKDEANVYVSAKKDWENFNIYKLNLDSQKFTPIVKSPYFQGDLSLYSDRLFYSSNYDGKYSVYCYDTIKDKNYKLTHDYGYASYPAYDETRNRLYFTGITSEGFDVFVKDADFSTEFNRSPHLSPIPSGARIKGEGIDVKEGGYFDNLKTVFPKVWFPVGYSDKNESYFGALLMGQTALGDFYYSGTLLYDTKENHPDGTMTLASYFFSPVITYAVYDSIDDESVETGINYPILQRLSPGLSLVMPGLAYRQFSDFEREEILPSLTLKWNHTKTRFRMKVVMPYETIEYINKQRFASHIYSYIHQYVKNSEVDLDVLVVDEPEYCLKKFPLIRGYTTNIYASRGVKCNLDFSMPLLKLRGGLWNPNFYFEDLCGVLFYDSINASDGKIQSSFGCELHLETKIMFGINYDCGVRWSLNRENAETTEIFFKTVL